MTAEKRNISEKEKQLLGKLIPKMGSTLREFIDKSDGTELAKIARSLCMGNDVRFKESIEALGEDFKDAVRKYDLMDKQKKESG